MKYIHTHREDFALAFFNHLKIHVPYEIEPDDIGQKLRIHVLYHHQPTFFISSAGYKAIYLERNISRQEQRLQFFHELGHLLRHSGSRLFMPAAFSDFQEWDARHFEFYAAMPWSMMRQFNLKNPDIVEELSEAFVVPKKFVRKKLLFVREKTDEYKSLAYGRQPYKGNRQLVSLIHDEPNDHYD